MGRTESLNLKNDYERVCGWCGHFNKSEMALFSECTDRYAQNLLDTADIVREAIFRQLAEVIERDCAKRQDYEQTDCDQSHSNQPQHDWAAKVVHVKRL
jgi:hypothetical protein